MAKKRKKKSLIKAMKAVRREAQLASGVNLSTRVANKLDKRKEARKSRRESKKNLRNGNLE